MIVEQEASEFIEDFLSHHGVLGMKWGRHTGGSSSSGSSSKKGPSRSEKRASKKIAKKDAAFEKTLSSNRKTFNLKIDLHNKTCAAMNDKHIPRINEKYKKAIDKNILLQENHPTTIKYHKEMQDAYVKELNIAAGQTKNASGTKKYSVHANDYDSFGFTVTSTDVKHDVISNDTFRINFIKDDHGVITGFSMKKDSMAQGEAFVKDFLAQ